MKVLFLEIKDIYKFDGITLSDFFTTISERSVFFELKNKIITEHKIEEESNIEAVKEENALDFIVLFLLHNQMNNFRLYSGIANSELRKATNKQYNPVPIVSIFWKNILWGKNSDSWVSKLNPDRRFLFLDSSIWHYAVPIDCTQDGKLFNDNLGHIIDKIKENHKKGLYLTIAGIEFIEFQARLVKNAFLKIIGGHSSFVSPFVFHSESKMKKMAERELEKLNGRIKNWQADEKFTWNALLIDDYGDKELKITEDKSIEKTKGEIILNILTEFNNEYEFHIDIKTTNSKDVLRDAKIKIIEGQDAKEQKDRKVFDIIFLDYLLGYKNDGLQREYGYEFFAKINNLFFVLNEETEKRLKEARITDTLLEKLNRFQYQEFENEKSLLDTLKTKIGVRDLEKYKDIIVKYTRKKLIHYKRPLGKFWVFPVTVFSTAMFDRLREQGISHLDDNWYISRGADPVNTPELFKYTLYHFLNLQLTEAINTKEDIISFILSVVSDASFDSGNNGKVSNSEYVFEIRQKVRRLYGVFMHKFGLQEALKDDYYHGSAFADSVLKYMHDVREDDLFFYERVRKLLYLVGFGTHSDAELMWDLLTYINAAVRSMQESFNKDEQKKISSFLEAVAKYISKLKKHNG